MTKHVQKHIFDIQETEKNLNEVTEYTVYAAAFSQS